MFKKNFFKKISNFFKLTEDMLCILNKNGTYETINKSWEVGFGYSHDELINKNFIDFTHPDDTLLAIKNIQKLQANKSSFVCRLRCKDNSYKNTHLKVCKYEKEIYIAASIIDSYTNIYEEIYKAMFENMPSGVAVYKVIDNGENFVIKDFNSSAEKLSLIKKEDILGKKVTEVFPGIKELGLFDVFKQVYKTGQSAYLPATLYEDERMSTWYENYVYKIPTGDVVSIYNDVSDQKKFELELIESKDMAISANITKSQFLANMSHEIRTPMNGIMGFLDLLETTALNEQQINYLKYIKQSSEKLMDTLNEILDISRVELGKFELENKVFDLKSEIADIMRLYSQKAFEKNLILKLNSKADRVLKGDINKLRQVISNLLHNAIKFTKQGSITLEIKCTNETNEYTDLLFAIKDTGIGISKQKKSELFIPFSQVDASDTRQYGGSGLGLYICKKIVDLFGGDIWLESELGNGATFYFTARFYRVLKELYIKFRNLNIILISDDLSFTKNFNEYFSELNCNVQIFDNSSVALHKLLDTRSASLNYFAIIIDSNIKGLNANEFSLALKALNTYKNVPLILVVDDKYSIKKANSFSGYILRSYNKNQLLIKLMHIRDEFLSKTSLDNLKTSISNKISDVQILLVDDDYANRVFFTELVKKYGFICDIAVNGAEAIEKCTKKSYDIIFMDCQMPIMNGYDAVKNIRSTENKNKSSRIIALTAHAMNYDREKCLSAGMDDYISKPIDIKNLLELISKNS